MIGEGGVTVKRLGIGARIRAWERGRRDRLASRRRRPAALGVSAEWYRAGWRFTQRGEILQLHLDLDGGARADESPQLPA